MTYLPLVFVQTSNDTINLNSDLESVFNALISLEKSCKKGFLVSKIKGFSNPEFTTQKCLTCPDGTIKGNSLIPEPIIEAIQTNTFTESSPVIYNHNLEEYIIEPLLAQDIIYIFGAGHVRFKLAKIAHFADFQVVITDDRKEFANREQFPHAKSVRMINNFNNALDNHLMDKNSYIVILTRGHLYDQTVLDLSLKTNTAYIGLIGGDGKRKQIYSNLQKKGVSDEALKKIHSPIGIKIHSETPAEIAVSIISEIIKIRAEK